MCVSLCSLAITPMVQNAKCVAQNPRDQLAQSRWRGANNDVSHPRLHLQFCLQWSLYFKTTHGTKKMWSYIAGGLKIKVI